MGLHDRVYFKEEISKMKSKRLLALALSFCVAFPGAMPAAASLEDLVQVLLFQEIHRRRCRSCRRRYF